MDMDIDLGKERVKLILRFLRACRYLKQYDVFGMDANQIASIIDYINLCDTCAVNSRDFRIHDILKNSLSCPGFFRMDNSGRLFAHEGIYQK